MENIFGRLTKDVFAAVADVCECCIKMLLDKK